MSVSVWLFIVLCIIFIILYSIALWEVLRTYMDEHRTNTSLIDSYTAVLWLRLYN